MDEWAALSRYGAIWMRFDLILLFALSVICDVTGQISFKIGVDRPSVAFWRGALGNYWLLTGIAVYALEIFVWLRILALVPLSLAFSIASLNVLGITLASRVILKESVGAIRWMGAVLVTVGIVIVGITS
jgi:undecaprenyl phosphate-alpha-L-ara4N flippase subunit ArnE